METNINWNEGYGGRKSLTAGDSGIVNINVPNSVLGAFIYLNFKHLLSQIL